MIRDAINRILRRNGHAVPSTSQSRPIELPPDRKRARMDNDAQFVSARPIMSSPGVHGFVNRSGVGREYASSAYELSMGGPLGLVNTMPVIDRLGLEIVDAMLADFPGTCVALKQTATLSTSWGWESASDDAEDQRVTEYLIAVFEQLDSGQQDPDGVNVGVRKKLRDMMSALAYGYSITNVKLSILERGAFAGRLGVADLKTKAPHCFSFDTDEYLNILPDGIIYRGNYAQPIERLPVSAFLIYSYHAPFGNPYGYSDMIRAYDRWNSLRYINKLWDIYLERTASGSWVATEDRIDPASALERAAVDSFLSGGSAKNGLRVSDRFTLQAFEAGGSSDIWQPAIDSRNAEIARAILVPDKIGFSAAQDSGGAYAMSKTHFDMLLMVIYELQSDLSLLMKSLGRRLIDASFGTREKYPKFVFAPMSDDTKIWWLSTVTTAIEKGVLVADETVMAKIRKTLDLPDAPAPSVAAAGIGDDPDTPLIDDPEFDAQADPNAGLDDLLARAGTHDRVIVVGGPRTGKTMLATRSAYEHGRAHRHTDSLVGVMEWSEISDTVAGWFDSPDRWIVEGVATVRALRKWLAANPDTPVPAAVLVMDRPRVVRKPGQRTLGRGVATVLAEIMPELERRGTTIIRAAEKNAEKNA